LDSILVQLIIENVVACFLRHSVDKTIFVGRKSAFFATLPTPVLFEASLSH